MASKIQGITVEIGGDTTKLGNALKEVNKQSKNLQSELKGVNTLLKMDPSNTVLLKQKQDLLNKSIGECKEKLNILKSTHEQVQEQFKKGEITEQQFRDFQREIVATENKLESLEKELKSFGSVGAQQIANVGEKMENLGNKITSVGKKTTIASVAAGGALASASKSAIDFETAWTGVTKTVDGTDQQLENIKQGLFDLSKTTASSANDIAAVAEAAGQLGIKTDNILAFTETMVRLGDSTNLSAEEAASSLAKFANVTKMSADDYGRLGATIVALGNNFATTEADIVEMATRLAATGELSGLTESQILALATSISSVGIEAEAGGSAMSTLLKKMQIATELGGKKLQQFASVAGMSATEFKTAFQEDAAGALSSFLSGLNDTERNGKSAIAVLNDMGLTEIRLSNTILSLANASDLMNNAIEIGSEAWKENTALIEESNKRYATTAARIEQFKNTIKELCSKLGELLLPIIQSVCDKLSNFTEWLTNLNPTTQKVILAVIALIAAMGPIIIILGTLIGNLGTILTFGPKLILIFGLIKTALSGLFKFILANPIVLVITTIIVAIVLLWNKCEWFRNMVMTVFTAIQNAVVAVWNSIKAVWDFVQPYFIALWEGIKTSIQPLVDAITGAFSAIWEFIKTIWDIVQPYFAGIWEDIKTIFSVNSMVLGTFFKIAWDIIKSVWDVVVQYFSTIWENIKIVFSVVATVLGGFFETAWTAIKLVWDNAIGFFTAIFNSIELIFSAITSVLHGDFSQAWEAIKSVVDVWAEYFQNIWENIKLIFSTVVDFFKSSFQAAWDGIKSVFSNVGSFFQSVWNTIKNIFTNIGTTIGDAVGGAFKSVVNSVISWAQNTINGFIRSVNWAIDVINNIPGVNISKLRELSLPKLKVGMANVPYDDYLALLHKGERVLTAKENKEYTDGKNEQPSNNNIDNSFNLTINSPKETSPAENARLLRREIQRYRLQHV